MTYQVLVGDCIASMRGLPDQSVNMCVTSPPYFGLRDYGMDGQIGLEATPDAFVARLVEVFREVKRVLRDDGTLWVNLGDSYSGSGKGVWSAPDEVKRAAGIKETYRPSENPVVKINTGLKHKDLIGIPWRVAFALQADGWYLRQDIIWHKPNPMPESVRDRCTKAHEYLFLLSKSDRYYFDAEAIKEPSRGREKFGNSRAIIHADRQDCDRQDMTLTTDRNKRSIWTVATSPFKGAHFATFPPDLIEPCILAGCPAGGTVLDPFGGSGTSAGVAVKHGRKAILCELNPEYAALMPARVAAIAGDTPDMFMEAAE
jgi:DNA modification methylase